MPGHPLRRFLAFAIMPNCGGSGEERRPCFNEHVVACAQTESTAHKKSGPAGLAGPLAKDVASIDFA